MKHFETQLNYIDDLIIREKTKQVIEQINEKFFKAAASSTGKYHPEYALGEGGLYRHTIAAVKIAQDLLQREYLRDEFPPDYRNYIIAALILHDCCKSGIVWDSKYTIFEHPLCAVELIEKVIGKDDEYTKVVGKLIASHMGEWNTSKYGSCELPKPSSNYEFFVHICDYLASRKYIKIDFTEEELNILP